MEKSYISEISYEQLVQDIGGTFDEQEFMWWVLEHADNDFITMMMADFIPVDVMVSELRDRGQVTITKGGA